MTALCIPSATRLSGNGATGGRIHARRRPVAIIAALVLLAAIPARASDPNPAEDLSVHEENGVYHVKARFTVPQRGSDVIAVLTDYEQIPRFLPDVRRSTVIERGHGRVVVEQEAVVRIMLFSKRVHLLLEIQEEADAICFRDRAGKSFTRYEGSWSVTEGETGAAIVYRLAAKPAFDVPEFLLRRLLRRDARLMIKRLQNEIGLRTR